MMVQFGRIRGDGTKEIFTEDSKKEMAQPEYRKEGFKYGWPQFFEDVDETWKGLSEIRGKVNWVVAIERGGLCLATVLADRLKASMYSIRVRSYVGRQRLPTIQVGWLSDKLTGTNVILVDDIADGGRTLNEVDALFHDKGINVLARVVLCKRSGLEGGYIYGREVDRGLWIDFPWWFPT